jgi:hypothetical protein
MPRRCVSATVMVGVALMAARLAAQPAIAAEPPQQVRFKPGATAAVLEGTLKGWDMKEYELRANQGQRAQLQVTSKRLHWLVVRFYPAAQSEGDHDLLNSDNANAYTWDGTLPRGGGYILRLFIRRAEARRGGTINYRARLSILPAAPPTESP